MIDNAALDQLQTRYIHALDRQDMAAWTSLFSDRAEASYICTTREHVKDGLPLALMMDDCRARIEDRLTYITKVWAGTFQNYQTRHLTQRIDARPGAGDAIELITSFAVYYTAEEDGTAAILTTGEYEDMVIREGADYRFLSKRAVLDTSVLPRYIVYPI